MCSVALISCLTGNFPLTLHRQENVDNPSRFSSILRSLEILISIHQMPIIYPIHPRSLKMINEFKLIPKGLTIIETFYFLGFLQLEKNARLILTDSVILRGKLYS